MRLRLSKFNIYNVLIPIHHDLSLPYVPHLLGFHLILLISQEYTCNWKDKWNINEYNHTFWCDDLMLFLAKKWCLTSLGHKQLHPIDKCCDKWLFSLTTKSKIKSQGWEKLRKFIQEKFEKKFKNFPSLLSFYVKLCKHGNYFF